MTQLSYNRPKKVLGVWQGPDQDLNTDAVEIRNALNELTSDFVLIDHLGQLAIAKGGSVSIGIPSQQGHQVVGFSSAISASDFGDPGFLTEHGVKSAYMAGSMANAISGIDLVTKMGQSGYLASYGSGGISPDKLTAAVKTIQDQLPSGPYAFNLIHSPNEPVLEQKAVNIFLESDVNTIEASAFLRLTPPVVQYRAAGLEIDSSGNILIKNKIIAKLSRPEVARHFMNPAPERILASLVEQGKITPQQAQLAEKIPLADDITVEADSGGHTDNRPLVGLLPSLTALRNQIQEKEKYKHPVRIGAGGGISTPASVLAAFSMGAAYVVTGSINQGCLEAGTSQGVKDALALAAAADVMMAPSADMFEMGVKVQVLKRGTMFPMRSQKLYETYQKYNSIDEIDPAERKDLEEKIFQNGLETVWQECVKFFSDRDPSQLEKARENPKRKMALIFRWYLGLATHWGIIGLPERVMDYQIWCGPSMGAFNDWARGTDLESPANRRVVDIADQIMQGAAFQYRLNELRLQGIKIPPSWERYHGNK